MSISDLFHTPEGPSTPFLGPTLLILDSIRVLVITLGIGVLITTPAAISRAKVIGQKLRLVALSLFVIASIGTELDHIGDYAHWRLLVNIFASIGAAYGIWSLFTWEQPAKIKE